jgi:cysteine desulfurase
MKQFNIYLDNAAATPVRSEVMAEMMPYFDSKFGNPSSIHRYGREAKTALESAREKCAEILKCSAEEIIFTSGGTESDYLAISGVVGSGNIDQLIVSQVEHPAVLQTAEQLMKTGLNVKFASVNKDALYLLDDMHRQLVDNSLYSIIYANNEVGTINPIKEIADIVHKTNSYIHTDACQAAGYLDMNVNNLGVDLMSINGSKIYGPKGVGLLYIKDGTPFAPANIGGGQEYGLRGGTENVAAIVGFAKALELCEANKHEEARRISKLRDLLISGLTKLGGIALLGSKTDRLPNNVNILIDGVDTQAVLMKLDEVGVYCSVASACSAEKTEPSHVLLAMGFSYEQSFQSLRFSLGNDTTEADINNTIQLISKILKKG